MSANERLDFERLLTHPMLVGGESHESIGSTNDRALQMASEGHVHCPYLVHARQQTKGRGRGTNHWWSDAGGLTFTLLLHTSDLRLPAEHLPLISLATGLGVAATVRHYLAGHDVRVKWPNDVYVGRQKICGILLESSQRMRHIALGIGVNVNNRFTGAPAELQSSATSLWELTAREHSPMDVLWNLLSQVDLQLAHLRADATYVSRMWSDDCLLTGQPVEVVCGNRVVAGVCRGINPQGALLVEGPLGMQTCVAGVVHWAR